MFISSLNRPNKITLKYHKQVLLKDRLFKNNNFDVNISNSVKNNISSFFGYQTNNIRFNNFFKREK